tara:strand:- start:226 stop:1335 length:1110 start_codon:yes stop_codon:yes gene_type:complete
MFIKNRKIVFFMPFIGGGGVEKNLYIISNHLSKKFKKILICTHSLKQRKKFNKKIEFIIPKIQISEKIFLRFKYLLCLICLGNFLIKNKDTIVFSFQANIYCILLCKILGIKIIVRSNSSPVGWYHNLFKKFLYKKIISLADGVIVNSIDFKNQMKKRFNVKVKCIYNPLDKKQIIYKSKKGKKDIFFNNKKNHLKIINIGRLTNQKDQITILKAINILKRDINLKLLIYGRGVEKDNLQNYINQNNLNSIVKIRTFIDNPYSVLKQSDLFILSSKYEGLPNVLLEALTLKKFIISSECPTGPREILLDGKNGYLFKIGDYFQLSKKIKEYQKNKFKIKKISQKAFKTLDRFDYQKNLNEYHDYLKKFL